MVGRDALAQSPPLGNHWLNGASMSGARILVALLGICLIAAVAFGVFAWHGEIAPMDELAATAGADPVAFRIKHLEDARARDVITLAADKIGWSAYQKIPGRGRGFAFARYKNLAAYCAIAAEVEIDRDSGRARLARAVAAVDSGQLVNPDGLKNQVEGAILQSAS